MKEDFNKPKSFGEILDHTFRLCKNRFPDFFMIALIVLGPVYLLQAIILLISGTSFVRELGSGDSWAEQVLAGFEGDPESINMGGEMGGSLVTLLFVIFYPIAIAAVLFAVQRLRNGEEFTAGVVIKQAYSKFWGIFGSSLLLGIIGFGMIFVSIFGIVFFGIFGAMVEPVSAIIISILLFLGIYLVIALLFSRWGFYLGPVIFEGEIPGMGKSWRLTKKRTWKTLGLFVILFLIAGVISYVINIIFGLFLGNSVLFTIIVDIVGLFTGVIFMVGYAVIYFDLVTRHGGSDLKEMIADYDNPNHTE